MPQPLPPELLDEILLLSLECHPSISLTLLPLSKHIHTFLLPHLYTHISLSSPHALQSLVQTLRSNPQSARHVRYFYLRGPQGRKEKDEEERGKAEYRDGWDERLEELEPGIEGEGEIATFDE